MNSGNIKLCAEIGKFGICANRDSIKDHPVFIEADAFELKRIESLPVMYNIQQGLIQSTPEYKIHQEVMLSGKECILHRETIIDEQNFKPLITPVIDGNDPLMLAQKLGIKFASFHIGGSNLKYLDKIKAGKDFSMWNLPSDYPSFKNAFLEVFEGSLKYITQRFKGTLAFENMAYIPELNASEFVCETRLINELLSSFPDIYLLLDIAHAQVTSYRYEIRVDDYISSLPLNRVMEIHLHHPAGPHDAHQPPTKLEYTLLDYVLKNGAKPSFITAEVWDDQQLPDVFKKIKETISQ